MATRNRLKSVKRIGCRFRGHRWHLVWGDQRSSAWSCVVCLRCSEIGWEAQP